MVQAMVVHLNSGHGQVFIPQSGRGFWLHTKVQQVDCCTKQSTATTAYTSQRLWDKNGSTIILQHWTDYPACFRCLSRCHGHTMAPYKESKLIDFHSSPPHLQFNKYVLRGYRPVSTSRGCLQSLFYLHNESGNIYTHGIPFVGFLLLLPLSIPWSEVEEWWICVVHYLACLSPTVGSVLYHIFMNHEGGVHIYDTLLSFDMFGVCLVNTLGALPIVHITLLCYPSSRRAAMLAYLFLSCHGIHCAVTARSNVRRLQSFAWQALFRLFLFILRWTGRGTGSPNSLHLYLIMDSLALLGGLVNISRVPERFSPGRFDYWLNSHQIMHVMVVLSIIYLHWGMLEDLAWLRQYQCPVDP